MVVVARRTEVRAGQPHEREVRAVGAAAYRVDERLAARRPDGLLRDLNHEGIPFNHLGHVAVCLRYFKLRAARAVFFIDAPRRRPHRLLALPQLPRVVVAEDILLKGALHRTAALVEEEKPLAPRGMFGTLRGRQQREKLHCQQLRVYHDVFRGPWVDAAPRKGDARRRGVEVFVRYLAEAPPVYGIGEVRAESFQVEALRAAPDLLVGSEGHGDPAVLDAIVGEQPLRHRQNFRDAGLVVGPEQRRAVGDDETPANVIFQDGKIIRPHDDVLLFVEENVAALVVYQARPDILAGRGWRDVHMGDEAQRRNLARRIGRDGGVEIAVFVKTDVGEPHLLQLFF